MERHSERLSSAVDRLMAYYHVPTPPGQGPAMVGAVILHQGREGHIIAIHRKHIFECQFDDGISFLFRLEFAVPLERVQQF